jgi:hypothetical protein
VLPLVGLGGLTPAAVVGALIAFGAAALAVAPAAYRVPPAVALAVLAPAIAAASVVVARQQGSTEGLTLVAAVLLFDLSNYVMGTGSHGGVLGAIVGATSVAILAVLVAAVLVPPYSGQRPWVMLGLVAALAPVGVRLAGRLGSAGLPALRRLDSLLLAGPVWVVAVAVLLHR